MQDKIGIISAYAEIENEEGYDKAKFYLAEGTTQKGTWKADWVAHATKNQKWYNLTIKATNLFGKTSIFDTKYFDPEQNHPASEVTAGTFDSGNFVFQNNLNVTGNLSGATLTANSSLTLNQLTSSPSNLTGFGKIYYKASDLAYTKLLLHFDGADASTTFTDSSIYGKTVTAVGTAQIDTAQSKFGGSSLLAGSGAYPSANHITLTDSADWNFGTGAFTIDFWWRVAGDETRDMYFFTQIDTATTGALAFWYGGSANVLAMYSYNANYATSNFDIRGSFIPEINTWYHIAFVRVDNSNSAAGWRIFINGVSQDLGLAAGSWNGNPQDVNANLNIMYGDTWVSWLDEFRISKGIARWTANFAVPTSAYSAGSAGGLMFMHENGTSVTLVPA